MIFPLYIPKRNINIEKNIYEVSEMEEKNKTAFQRFKRHTVSGRNWWIAAVALILCGLLGFNGAAHSGNVAQFLVCVGLVCCGGGWIAWSWKQKENTESPLFAFNLFKFRDLREFAAMENKLLALMEQSPRLPRNMNDTNTVVECLSVDDMSVCYKVRMNDVVGGLEFIEENADKWAACFGDRDGADVQIWGTGIVGLTFDRAGKTSANVAVEW